MPTTVGPANLVLLFDTDLSQGFDGQHTLRLTANLHHYNDDGELRSFLDSDSPEFADLQVGAYASDDMMADGSYGWSVEYRSVYVVDLARAEGMVRCLRRITRRLEALASPKGEHYNPPRSFEEYVLRVAKILGCRQFAYWSARRPNGTRAAIELPDATAAAAWVAEQVAIFHTAYPERTSA
jgi:hypothetical protein